MSSPAMSSRILELFGHSTSDVTSDWKEILARQGCPFLNRKCLKVRKSRPEISIGTCSVAYGKERKPIVICPYRLLERRQIFSDCLHLLTLHEPGNELHIVSEIPIPGGSVDYFLVSAIGGKAKDFVGIELQALDTTGTVWPERQRFLESQGLRVARADAQSTKPFGMNWKMTAKTILVQLHHKIETFEHLGKHLVLVLQDHMLDYMSTEFSFGHLSNPGLAGHSMQFHAYSLQLDGGRYRLMLAGRRSTDADGISVALGLQISPQMERETIISLLESKLSPTTLFNLDPGSQLEVPLKPVEEA